MSKITRAIDDLWLPSHVRRSPSRPPTGRRFLNRRCCCGCKTCTCEECAAASPYYAPCCWKVVIAGIVDGSCSDCEVLNKTYYLSQDTSGGCVWSEGAVCGDCDPTDITLSVTLDGSDYIVTVTMDGHVWRKNYGTTKPECCGLTNETIPHTTNTGDCDSSSATCVITALEDGHECITASCCTLCTVVPSEWAVDLSGGNLTDRDCDECDKFSNTYVLQEETLFTCFWRYCETSTCPSFWLVTVGLPTVGAGLYKWEVKAGWASKLGEKSCTIPPGTGPFVQFAIWRSVSFGLPGCLTPAGPDNKISLTLSTGFLGTSCFGSPSTTIEIWDANA